jgi:hypothetical protein
MLRGGAIALVASAILAPSARADDEAAISRIVADAVRDYGQPCTDPAHATRDAEDSQPDREAWLLRCKNESYRVRFVGSERHTEIERIAD